MPSARRRPHDHVRAARARAASVRRRRWCRSPRAAATRGASDRPRRSPACCSVGETRSAGPPRAHRSQYTAPAFSTHESTLTYAPLFRLPLAYGLVQRARGQSGGREAVLAVELERRVAPSAPTGFVGMKRRFVFSDLLVGAREEAEVVGLVARRDALIRRRVPRTSPATFFATSRSEVPSSDVRVGSTASRRRGAGTGAPTSAACARSRSAEPRTSSPASEPVSS